MLLGICASFQEDKVEKCDLDTCNRGRTPLPPGKAMDLCGGVAA